MISREHENHGSTGSERLGRISLIEARNNLVITPDFLMDDNHSQYAQVLRHNWREIRNRGELDEEDDCGDARTRRLRARSVVSNRSIASSGDIQPVLSIYRDPRVRSIAIKAHFSAEILEQTGLPGGCGGGGRKGEHLKGGVFDEDIDVYVRRHIPHSDVVINAISRASRIASLVPGKPVMAAAQDHLTGRIYPVSFYFRPDKESPMMSLRAIPEYMMVDQNYNPAEIYKNGMPKITLPQLSGEFEVFKDAIIENDRQVQENLTKYTDYSEAQKVQNPKILIISDSIKPVEIRFPNSLAAVPGSYFEIRLGRTKIDEDTTVMDPATCEHAINQAHYSVAHHLAHFNKPGQDFSDLNTVLIETRNGKISENLANELAAKPWMKDWIKTPQHQVLISEVISGQTNSIRQLV